MNQQFMDIAQGIFVIVVLVFVIIAIVWGYNAIDDQGWLSHDRESVIVAHTSWMVGESKTCSSTPSPPAYDVTKTVYCEGMEEHTVKVTFHGRTKRDDAKDRLVSWKCVRRSDSFECYALD